MGYQTQREKVREFFLNKVFPSMDDRDLFYDKLLSEMSAETGCSESVAEEVLRSLIKAGKIKEYHVITLTDDELLKRKQQKNQTEKEFEEVVDGFK